MTGAPRTTPADITASVLASFERCDDPRLRDLMRGTVSHLHAFATEAALSEAEWRELIGILTATGEITASRPGGYPARAPAAPAGSWAVTAPFRLGAIG